MLTVMPIRDLRDTKTISDIAHKKQEPIIITKNGYSDLVVMSVELYEQMAKPGKEMSGVSGSASAGVSGKKGKTGAKA